MNSLQLCDAQCLVWSESRGHRITLRFKTHGIVKPTSAVGATIPPLRRMMVRICPSWLQRLARLAPEAVLDTLKGPLERDLSGSPQQDKRSATISAIEVLAGLLSSGVVFTSNGERTPSFASFLTDMHTAHAIAAGAMLVPRCLKVVDLHHYGQIWCHTLPGTSAACSA